MVRALILVGGFGTRLRPLTLTVPKPIVDFANLPMIIHQIQALKDAGVDEVVLAINYQPQVMMDFLKEWEAKLGIKITCSQEDEPMGTAGPLGLARKILAPKGDGSDDPFFVLNSDVICDFPLKEMLEFHRAKGAEGTVLVTRVEDPSKYGVVVLDAEDRVERFVEKPQTFVGDRINAGIYCLSPGVLDRIENRPTSIEKETFPAVAADRKLFAFTLPGYWMDVGQPRDYLTGLKLHLGSVRAKDPSQLASSSGGYTVEGNVLIDPSATIGAGCKVGPNVCIGKDCVLGEGVRVRDAVLLHRVKLLDHSCVSDSIVGWGSSVGRWARVANKAVIGEDCHVKDEVVLNGTVVLPHKELKESQMEPGTIVM